MKVNWQVWLLLFLVIAGSLAHAFPSMFNVYLSRVFTTMGSITLTWQNVVGLVSLGLLTMNYKDITE